MPINAYKISKQFIAFLVLVITLATASGFTGVSTNLKKPKTELLCSKNTHTKNVYNYQVSPISYKHLAFNNFIVFNFKCLLNSHIFDISNTLQSQKKATIKLLKQNLLEQNLIAQLNTRSYKLHTS